MTGEELFQLIRSGARGQEKAARYLYSNMRLRNSVRKAMGIGARNDTDYWDVYHTLIIQFFKYVVKHPEFELGDNYYNYMIKAAQNLWYMELRKRKKHPSSLPEKFDVLDVGEMSIERVIENDETRSMIDQILSKIGSKCKDVLMMWAEGRKMEEIRMDLGLNTLVAARKRKFDCLKRVIKYLDQHPVLKKLLQ